MAPRRDAVVVEAVDAARQAADEIAARGAVGEHLGVRMVDERMATHAFACRLRGYAGWQWEVSIARAPRARNVTVCETYLAPAEGALLAPRWVPWEQRLEPQDVGPEDVTPFREHDPRLSPVDPAELDAQAAPWEATRPRRLTAQALAESPERWAQGPGGPQPDHAQRVSRGCSTCGYLMPLAGAWRDRLGICASPWSPDDGRVVTLDHGCGAHSEVDIERGGPDPLGSLLVDDYEVEWLAQESAGSEPDGA